MTKTRKAPIRTTGVNFYRLCQLMERDKETTDQFTRQELAIRYSKEMNHSISKATIGMAAEAVGCKTKRAAALARATTNGTTSRGRLERVVRKLCEKLGENFDELARS